MMHKFGRIKILGSLIFNLLRLRLSAHPQKGPRSKQLLFDSFKHLGGVYVKFLQMLALNIDFMSGWAGPSEFDVFEAVDYEPIDIYGLLAAEIPYYQGYFRQIETRPFAAGSFAQVYHAELAAGQKVIIKVQRPSLVRNLKSDLRLLGFVARMANWLYPNAVADVREAYRQFAATTLAEGDYAREVANAGWFYEYFKDIPDIIVPQTYKELSSKHIITQDYVGGISLADVISQQKEGFDPKRLVHEQLGSDLWVQMERLGTEFLISTLKDGFVFGDPHPGNIKLLPENKLALVDFGIAAPTSKNRSGWLNLMREELKLYNDEFDPHSFVIAMLNYYDPELAQSIKVVNRALNPDKHQDILDKVSHIAAEIIHDRMDEPMMQSFFRRRMMSWLFTSINEGNRFGIKINLDDTSLLKAGHTYLNLVAQLGRHNGDNLTMLRRALGYASDWAEHESSFYQQSEHIQPEHAFEVVSTWLSQVADRDPMLYSQIINSEEVYA